MKVNESYPGHKLQPWTKSNITDLIFYGELTISIIIIIKI